MTQRKPRKIADLIPKTAIRANCKCGYSWDEMLHLWNPHEVRCPVCGEPFVLVRDRITGQSKLAQFERGQ